MSNLNYRPEIDGLRAIAVVSVVLFHADFGFPGGFTGVDVFFVISGFLITSLIWKDLEAGRFSFAQFWERRARRIIPALVVVTVACLLAGSLLLLPEAYKSLGRAAVAQAVFAANVHYWKVADYFAPAADEKPLLHTWSLAVEEQFYFVVPFVLWLLFRFAGRHRRVVVTAAIFAGLVASFVLSVYGVEHSPSATFYFLPTRAWELLIGAVIPFVPLSFGILKRQSSREVFSLIGLGLIIFAIATYGTDTPFPGLAAVPPCLGTALIIWANGRSGGGVPTLVGRVLSVRPMVFVGLISYSLYLWHWPLLAFSRYAALAPLSVSHRVLLVAAAFVLAVASWRYVETPFRTKRLGASQRSMFAMAAAGLSVVVLGGVVCYVLNGLPQRLPPRARELAVAQSEMSFIHEVLPEDVEADALVPIGVDDPAIKPSLIVWGDSHAMSVMPAVDAFLKEQGLTGRAATHSQVAPVLGWYETSSAAARLRNIRFNNGMFDYIKAHKIRDVMLGVYWRNYAAKEKPDAATFRPAVVATVRQLCEAGVRVWVLEDVPYQPFDVPRGLVRSVIYGTDVGPFCSTPQDEKTRDILDQPTRLQISEAGGRIVGLRAPFLDPSGMYYRVIVNDVPLYRDDNHLTTRGAKLVLLPLLRKEVELQN